MPAHLAAALDLLGVQLTSPERSILGGTHLPQRPLEIDRGRPRRGEHRRRLVEVLPTRRRERVAVRGRHSDRGRTADCQGANCLGHLARRAAGELDLLVGKLPLIEQDDRVLLEPNDPLGLYVPSSHEARYFACSSVSTSMATPIVSSLSRAISLSISCGTG